MAGRAAMFTIVACGWRARLSGPFDRGNVIKDRQCLLSFLLQILFPPLTPVIDRSHNMAEESLHYRGA